MTWLIFPLHFPELYCKNLTLDCTGKQIKAYTYNILLRVFMMFRYQTFLATVKDVFKPKIIPD